MVWQIGGIKNNKLHTRIDRMKRSVGSQVGSNGDTVLAGHQNIGTNPAANLVDALTIRFEGAIDGIHSEYQSVIAVAHPDGIRQV
jgi:hypothetical protein